MNKVLPVHHTISDWDFERGATNRSLSAARYISAPTSLRFLEPTSSQFLNNILCRIPATLCLPQGEVRTWVYGYYLAFTVALFRNQAALGSANELNCYQVYLAGTTSRLVRKLGGVLSFRDDSTCTSFINTWTHYRVFWYNGETPGGTPALCVDLYREIAGEWVKEGSTLYDTDNSFKDSAINRAGFRARSRNNWPQYWDDTEIWGPV